MPLQQTSFRRLSFDPTLTQSQNGYESRFEWVIDHENQERGDWCWAACLRNALSCVGFYVKQDEVVAKFQMDHDTSPDVSDGRIPTPKDVRDLWRLYGFHRADWRDEALPFEALAEEIATNGPVQIELWRQGADGNRHLALIAGVREKATGPGYEVRVSDPASPAPVWRSYEEMRGPNPLVSNFGEWRRTYVGLEYEKGYLRRFFGRPSRYLSGFAPEEEMGGNGAEPLQPAPLASLLSFDPPPDPDPPLIQELALATYGYRHFRYRTANEDKREARRADLRRGLFLFESIQVWRPSNAVDYDHSLSDQIQFYRWHHQIHNSSGPRYYAEAFFFPRLGQRFERAWRTAWIGERWMAERVHRAIREMDSKYGDREETARLVLFRRHGLVTLFLPHSGIHLVVSAQSAQKDTFPLLKKLTDEQLREALKRLKAQTVAELAEAAAV